MLLNNLAKICFENRWLMIKIIFGDSLRLGH